MVARSPLGWEPIPARPRRAWRLVFGGVAAVVLAIIVLNAIPVSYYALAPGDALAVNGPNGAVTVRSAHTGSGRLFLTTVALQSHVSLWDRLLGTSLHPNLTLVPKRAITNGASPTQFQAQTHQEMTGSQLAAKVAALRRLGYPVPEDGDGALVIEVGSGTPAAGQLRPGDIIKKVDGRPVKVAANARALIRAHRPGDTVSFEVSRPAAADAVPGALGASAQPARGAASGSTAGMVGRDVRTVACGSGCPGDEQRPLIGVALATDAQSFKLPPDVGLNIETDNIGGPSAGLAFTLGAIDSLTSHNLTGGHRVAVTGTIDADGTVGPVGGVQQKTVAVENAHCDYFLVPADEFNDAQRKARGHSLKVVKVNSLDDALTFLGTIGGSLGGIPARSGGAHVG